MKKCSPSRRDHRRHRVVPSSPIGARLPKLRIFLSHKLKDSQAATRLKQLLQNHGPDLHVFVAAEKRAGSKWEPKVEEELAKADWLVLIYTQEDDEWDWCLYESGFFSGHHHDAQSPAGRSKFRLICLHPFNVKPPNPFRSWDSLPAVSDKIALWLRDIFCGSDGFAPVNKNFVNNPDFGRLVSDVISIFKPPVDPPTIDKFFQTLQLELTSDQMAALDKDWLMPADAVVRVSRDVMNVVFGSATQPSSEQMKWATFVARLRDSHKSWTDAIAPCIVNLSTAGIDSPYLPLLRTGRAGNSRLFRPVITRRTWVKDHWTRFEIMFATTPDTIQLDKDEHVDLLTHLLMLARTFRWGILYPYSSEIQRATSRAYKRSRTELVAKLLADIKFAVIESANRGVEVEKDLESVFPRATFQFYVSKIWTPWTEIYPQICAIFDNCRSGKSHSAESACQSMKDLKELMDQLLNINGLFIFLVARRLVELAVDHEILGRSSDARKLRNDYGRQRLDPKKPKRAGKGGEKRSARRPRLGPIQKKAQPSTIKIGSTTENPKQFDHVAI